MNHQKELMPQRIQWVDLLKGATILLVITGHTIIGIPKWIIYSFHMPLFFFLSGYTYHPPKNVNSVIRRVKKNVVHLLVPAYLVWFVRWFLFLIRDNLPFVLKEFLLSGFFASGADVNAQGIVVPGFGMMWFLVVLFSIRVLYDLLCVSLRKQVYIAVSATVLLAGGLQIKRPLPFSFDLTMLAVFFFFTGHLFSRVSLKNHTIITIVLSGASWGGILCLILLKHDYFEMTSRNYPYGVLSILMATSACVCLALIAGRITLFPRVRKILATLGSHSMILYVIHAFNVVWFRYLKNLCNNSNRLSLLLRLLIDLTIMTIVLSLAKRLRVKKELKTETVRVRA